MVEGRSPRGDPRNRPRPNSISLGFSFAHLQRTSNHDDSCVLSQENVMSSRGGVVSKMGTENFYRPTVSSITQDWLIQTGREAYQIVDKTLNYSFNVLYYRLVGYSRTCELCTKKQRGSRPITGTLCVSGIGARPSNNLQIYVLSMFSVNFAPGC